MSRDQVDEINLSSQEAMNTVVAQIRRVTLLERVASRQDVRALTGVVPPPVDWVPACLRGKLGNFAATAVATSPPPVITGGMLDGWLGVAVRRGTRLLDISVTHQVPEVAKALADAVACQYLAEIGNSNTKGRSKVILLLEGETKEARAKYHTVAQIANVTAHPILGAIPEIKLHHLAVAEKHFRKRHPGQLANLHESWEKRVVFRSGTASTSYVEMYRSLRASVSRLGDESKRKITLFSSALPGEGKSLTSANFAAAAAGQGRKTLHIDMDLRKPAVHKIFGLSREQEHGGITECLANLAPFEEVTRRPSASPRRAGSSPV